MSWYTVTISPCGAIKRAAVSLCHLRLSAGSCRSSVEVRALSANLTISCVTFWELTKRPDDAGQHGGHIRRDHRQCFDDQVNGLSVP
jgi:hypothetical protein